MMRILYIVEDTVKQNKGKCFHAVKSGNYFSVELSKKGDDFLVQTTISYK